MHPENNDSAMTTGVIISLAFLIGLWNLLWTIPLALFGIEPIMREAFGVDLSFPAVWFTLLTLITLFKSLRRNHPRSES